MVGWRLRACGHHRSCASHGRDDWGSVASQPRCHRWWLSSRSSLHAVAALVKWFTDNVHVGQGTLTGVRGAIGCDELDRCWGLPMCADYGYYPRVHGDASDYFHWWHDSLRLGLWPAVCTLIALSFHFHSICSPLTALPPTTACGLSCPSGSREGEGVLGSGRCWPIYV